MRTKFQCMALTSEVAEAVVKRYVGSMMEESKQLEDALGSRHLVWKIRRAMTGRAKVHNGCKVWLIWRTRGGRRKMNTCTVRIKMWTMRWIWNLLQLVWVNVGESKVLRRREMDVYQGLPAKV